MTTLLRAEMPMAPEETVNFTLLKMPQANKLNELFKNILDGKVIKEINTPLLEWQNIGLIWMFSMKDLLMLPKVKI
jgi:hypothetical protein